MIGRLKQVGQTCPGSQVGQVGQVGQIQKIPPFSEAATESEAGQVGQPGQTAKIPPQNGPANPCGPGLSGGVGGLPPYRGTPSPPPNPDIWSRPAQTVFAFSETPEVGQLVLSHGQLFELIASRPYQRRDGAPSSVLTWRSRCPQCTAVFTVDTGLIASSHPRKRCANCAAQGRPVGKRSRGQA